VKDVAYVPKITPEKGQEHLTRHKALVELLLRMQISVGVCLYLLRKGGRLPHTELKHLGDVQVSAKGNHPLFLNTCSFWVR
jgi:hypothetical protein